MAVKHNEADDHVVHSYEIEGGVMKMSVLSAVQKWIDESNSGRTAWQRWGGYLVYMGLVSCILLVLLYRFVSGLFVFDEVGYQFDLVLLVVLLHIWVFQQFFIFSPLSLAYLEGRGSGDIVPVDLLMRLECDPDIAQGEKGRISALLKRNKESTFGQLFAIAHQ